ncbi:hypothetical protein WJX74_001375 [Apatococcus lobatus]|uniref:Zinc-finger domain-containing protein n=1 Tax=Apatococcus lobatus TaxID=904363 RepID=A0AAW1S539_9CHLO
MPRTSRPETFELSEIWDLTADPEDLSSGPEARSLPPPALSGNGRLPLQTTVSYSPRVPSYPELVQYRKQKGPRLQQLQQKQGIGMEQYTLEHVRQVVRFEARLTYEEGRDTLLCKDAGHPPGCRECKTCHFCRQKYVTNMTSCVCQNSRYLEVSTCSRGHWCGACLSARMGENIHEVIRNRDWRCPCCRGICNCSSPRCCRLLSQLHPTGQLRDEARNMGFKSVAHYLIFTLVNLDREGMPMADLTNLQQLPQQLPPSGLAPVISRAVPQHDSGLVARKRMRAEMMAAAREKSARQLRSLEQQFPMLARPSDMEQRLQAAGFGWGALDKDQDDADDDEEQDAALSIGQLMFGGGSLSRSSGNTPPTLNRAEPLGLPANMGLPATNPRRAQALHSAPASSFRFLGSSPAVEGAQPGSAGSTRPTSAGHQASGSLLSTPGTSRGGLLPYGQMANDPLDGPHPGIAHHAGGRTHSAPQPVRFSRAPGAVQAAHSLQQQADQVPMRPPPRRPPSARTNAQQGSTSGILAQLRNATSSHVEQSGSATPSASSTLPHGRRTTPSDQPPNQHQHQHQVHQEQGMDIEQPGSRTLAVGFYAQLATTASNQLQFLATLPAGTVLHQMACCTAKEDFRDMLRILTRNIMEPIKVSTSLKLQPEEPEVETYLTSQSELRNAVAFLLRAAELLDPDEVKFDITRLIFNQEPFASFKDSDVNAKAILFNGTFHLMDICLRRQFNDHVHQVAVGALTMLEQVAAEHEALAGMRERTLSIGQPVNIDSLTLPAASTMEQLHSHFITIRAACEADHNLLLMMLRHIEGTWADGCDELLSLVGPQLISLLDSDRAIEAQVRVEVLHALASALIRASQATRGVQRALAAVLLEHAVPKLEALVAVAYPFRASSTNVLSQKPGYGCSGISNIKVEVLAHTWGLLVLTGLRTWSDLLQISTKPFPWGTFWKHANPPYRHLHTCFIASALVVPDATADRSTCLHVLHDWLCAMLDSSGRHGAHFLTQVLASNPHTAPFFVQTTPVEIVKDAMGQARARIVRQVMDAAAARYQGLAEELHDIVEILSVRTREASQQRPQVLRRWERTATIVVLSLAQSAAVYPRSTVRRASKGTKLQAQLLKQVAAWVASSIRSLLQPSAGSGDVLDGPKKALESLHPHSLGDARIAAKASALVHFAKLLDLLAELCPVRILAQDQSLLEPIAMIMASCFQGVPQGFSPEGLRVVFETLAGVLLPSTGMQPGQAAAPAADSEGPHPLLQFVISMFTRRDVARSSWGSMQHQTAAARQLSFLQVLMSQPSLQSHAPRSQEQLTLVLMPLLSPFLDALQPEQTAPCLSIKVQIYSFMSDLWRAQPALLPSYNQATSIDLESLDFLNGPLQTGQPVERSRALAAFHCFFRALCGDILASVASVLKSSSTASASATGLVPLTTQGAAEARSKLMELLGPGRPLEPLDRLQASLHTPASSTGPAPSPPADQSWTIALVGLQLLKNLGQLGEKGIGWMKAALPQLARLMKVNPVQAQPLREAYESLLGTASQAGININAFKPAALPVTATRPGSAGPARTRPSLQAPQPPTSRVPSMQPPAGPSQATQHLPCQSAGPRTSAVPANSRTQLGAGQLGIGRRGMLSQAGTQVQPMDMQSASQNAHGGMQSHRGMQSTAHQPTSRAVTQTGSAAQAICARAEEQGRAAVAAPEAAVGWTDLRDLGRLKQGERVNLRGWLRSTPVKKSQKRGDLTKLSLFSSMEGSDTSCQVFIMLIHEHAKTSLHEIMKSEEHALPFGLDVSQLVLRHPEKKQVQTPAILVSCEDTHAAAQWKHPDSRLTTSTLAAHQELMPASNPAGLAAIGLGLSSSRLQQPTHHRQQSSYVPHETRQQATVNHPMPSQRLSQPLAPSLTPPVPQQPPPGGDGRPQQAGRTANHTAAGLNAATSSRVLEEGNAPPSQLQPLATRQPSAADSKTRPAAAVLAVPAAKRHCPSRPTAIRGSMASNAPECRYPHADQIFDETMQYGSIQDDPSQGHAAEQGPGSRHSRSGSVSGDTMNASARSLQGRSADAAPAASSPQLGSQHQQRRPDQHADAAKCVSQREPVQLAMRPGLSQGALPSNGNRDPSQADPAAAALGLKPDSQGTQPYNWSQMRQALLEWSVTGQVAIILVAFQRVQQNASTSFQATCRCSGWNVAGSRSARELSKQVGSQSCYSSSSM